MSRNKHLFVVTGPTASGKTQIGIKLANLFETVVISADSRQFYKEMDIGTAKPAKDELQQAQHYFIDFLDIKENYSAGNFEKDVLQLLKQLFIEKDIVVMAGGSGLYINAVCYGFDEMPDIEPGIRKVLNEEYLSEGIQPLLSKLKVIDPVYYEQVDKANSRRVIRALEVSLSTGKAFSSFRRKKSVKRPFSIKKIALDLPREVLYQRINERCDKMLEAGLMEEVKKLFPFKNYNALQTVGYREFFDHLDGKYDFKTAVEMFKQHSRNYAKRQITWIKKDPTVKWMQAEEEDEILSYFGKSVEKEV